MYLELLIEVIHILASCELFAALPNTHSICCLKFKYQRSYLLTLCHTASLDGEKPPVNSSDKKPEEG